jgi:hypothetical protein
MSGVDYESYAGSYKLSARDMDTDEGRTRRSARLTTARSEMMTKSAAPRAKRATDELYDSELVTNKITKPAADVERVHIAIIDNSGSNATIAAHLRTSSGYFMSVLNQIDPKSQIAWMYASDHCDGNDFIQEVDFLSPGKKGDKALYSSLYHVHGAGGGDAAEAFECSLWQACDIDFGAAKEKHLYLATDVVAHGMGMTSDEGCPNQRDWKKSKEKVYKTFDSFCVVGCGDDEETGKLQTKFLKTDRIPFDFIDLSSIKEARHRAAMTGNAILFLIARKVGLQNIELFLSFLYEKWLEDPIFGKDTDQRAKDMINRFGKYIEGATDAEIKKVMAKILS